MNKWTTKPYQCASACSFQDAKKDKFEILITDPVNKVIKSLCSKVKVEWQLLLIGEGDQEGIIITDYYVPKQEVTGSTVKNLDCIDAEAVKNMGIVATLHSHANMNVFFSSVDDESTNNSFIKTHLVVNNKFEFVACNRVDLPCGMVKFNSADVLLEESDVEIKGFDAITVLKGAGTHWNYMGQEAREPLPWFKEEYEYGSYESGDHAGLPIVDMHGAPLKNGSHSVENAEQKKERAFDLHFGSYNKKNRKNKYKMLKGGME